MFYHCPSAWIDAIGHKLGTYVTTRLVIGQMGLILDEKYGNIDATFNYLGPGILEGCVEEVKYSARTGSMYVLLSSLSTCRGDQSCCQMYVTVSRSQCHAHCIHEQYEM